MANRPALFLLCRDPALREILTQYLRQNPLCELLLPEHDGTIDQAQLVILDGDDPLAAVWQADIKARGLPAIQLGGPADILGHNSQIIEKPLRLQMITDSIQKLIAREQRPAEIQLGLHFRLELPERRLANHMGGQAHLTEKETAILLCLHTSAGPVPRERLMQEIWGHTQPLLTHTLETHLSRLRRKIEEVGGDSVQIIAGDGGYRLIVS